MSQDEHPINEPERAEQASAEPRPSPPVSRGDVEPAFRVDPKPASGGDAEPVSARDVAARPTSAVPATSG